MSHNRLIIFDTTMRDGEQSPGASMTKDQKLRIARALERMRVDVIEAGFPAASNGDFEAVRAIAGVIKDSTVCGLCRANDREIQRGIDALHEAKGPWRIHTFIATSPIHMEKKLRMTPEQVLEQARLAVRYAKKACPDVEFSPEDGSRSEPDFLCRVLEAAIKEGATTINIPDTVGYAVPQQFGEFIRQLREKIPNSDKAVWSVHCHNDLGMAVANSLAAVMIGGARQVECTINGMGERAGNCSLEEVVMAVKTRADFFGLTIGINTQRLYHTSRLVSHVTGIQVQRNKAIVGQNAFAHEAGIHQDGMLKERRTYEIMQPQDVGISRTDLVLGKHSGRHALRQRVRDLGYHLSEEQLQHVFDGFKALADRKKVIYDADIEALAEAAIHSGPAAWTLEAVTAHGGSGTIPTAAVCLWHHEGKVVREAAVGDGPVD